jgi:multidrug efflux pump subunit AcrA (membrane-fusion protein)
VPAEAIVRDENDTPFVFVKTKEGYERRQVESGAEKNGRVEIRSGLSEEEAVVTVGAHRLFHRQFRGLYREED